MYIVDIDDINLSKEDFAVIHSNSSLIVSYLSIGEAEEYRDYWQAGWRRGSPLWLDNENPDWNGNYKVKFWDAEWQAIIISKLDSIIAAGYDGVYLDIIDGYEYWQDLGVSDADKYMVSFVKNISAYAKNRQPGFLIIPQNSPELTHRYMDDIDGLGKEDTWYHEDNTPVDIRDTNKDLQALDKVIADGKFVLVIDYVSTKEVQCLFIKHARERGYVPTIGNRLLRTIVELPHC